MSEDAVGDDVGAPLGVAVVGYAFMGKAHSNAWRNVAAFHPDVPPVRQQVLVGRDPAHVKTAAAQYGWAESSTDWRSVLDRDDVHIVDLCIPGHLHCELAVAALEAGKHVIVEKPLANTLAEAEQMAAAAAACARARRLRDGGLQLPADAGAGAHPAARRRRPDRDGPPGARVVPPGLAGRRGRPDDLADEA